MMRITTLRCRSLAVLGAILVFGLIPLEATAVTGWTTVYREVSTFGAVISEQGDPGLFETKVENSDAGGLFHQSVTTHLSDQGNSVFSTAWQRSDFNGLVYTFEGTFEARGDLGGGGVFAEGFGASIASPHFTLDAAQEIFIHGVGHASGAGIASVQVTNGGGGQVFLLTVSEDTQAVSEVMVLPAGSYTLTLQSGGYGREFPEFVQPSNGSLAVTVGLGAPASGVDASGRFAGVRVVPNPVRGMAELRFAPEVGRGERLTIADVTGRRVSDLGVLREGTVRWDPRGADGAPLGAGVYCVRGGERNLGRVIVVR
ncbi:MAG: hypothetical protein IT349_10755 [Candidatus Eisenbacteria bacterium]|nr:hypothetical protein [Candidatus Eisenbacteria bacterium]